MQTDWAGPTKVMNGLSSAEKAVRSLMPSRTSGLLLKSSRAWAVGSSWALKAGEARRALTPIAVASASWPETGGRRAAKPGRRSAKRPAVFTRNGRTRGSARIAASSVSGEREMVSWM